MKPQIKTALAFLDGLRLTEIAHNADNLHGHLVRTCQRLVEWGFPESVCLAGLFHSVFGTSHFSHQALSVTRTPELQQVIGDRAVELISIFSVASRPTGLINGLVDGRVNLVYLNASLPVSRETALDLISIEFSNLLDQGQEHHLLLPLSKIKVDFDLPQPVKRSWGQTLQ